MVVWEGVDGGEKGVVGLVEVMLMEGGDCCKGKLKCRRRRWVHRDILGCKDEGFVEERIRGDVA